MSTSCPAHPLPLAGRTRAQFRWNLRGLTGVAVAVGEAVAVGDDVGVGVGVLVGTGVFVGVGVEVGVLVGVDVGCGVSVGGIAIPVVGVGAVYV